jgi:hypothetical protein
MTKRLYVFAAVLTTILAVVLWNLVIYEHHLNHDFLTNLLVFNSVCVSVIALILWIAAS